MKVTTHNTPVTNNRPQCPAQFLQSIEQPADPACIADAALVLNNQARAVCITLRMNASDEPDLLFKANDTYIMDALDAVYTLLEQQQAILEHPQTGGNR